MKAKNPINPIRQTTRPASKLALPAAAVFLAVGLTAVAQSWQTILPSPAYSLPGPTGRSILVGPATLPDGTPELHLGMQTSPGNPSVLRFRPDDASFADGDIEFVDNRLSWVQDLLDVPGDGIYAVGEATIQSKRQSATRWVVRRSSTGDANTWADVGTPYVHPSKSPGDSVATAIVADPDGTLFVAGQAIGGQGKESGSRWIVRRKLAAAQDSAWETVLDRFIGYDIYLRPGLCLIPGAGQNGAPVLFTSAHIDTRWAILRSLNGGDSWQLVDTWPEAAGAATARRIEFDPVTGHVYAVGWRGNWITGRQGWVVRRSIDAGNTWQTLLDEPTDDWLAAIGVAFGSDGSVLVLGEDRSPDGFLRCVVLRNAPGSIGSATWERMYPFSITDASGTRALYSVGSAIKADAFGDVFVIGRVHNWEADGVLYLDGHLGLTRLHLLP